MPACRSILLLLLFAAGIAPLTFSANASDRVIISEDFSGIDLTLPDGTHKKYPDPTTWAFTFYPGTKWPDSYGDGTNWLEGNGESQVYLTARRTHVKNKVVPTALRYDPFSIQKDGLHITADLLSKDQQQAYLVGGHRRFGSGMLLMKPTFKYGTVKVVAKLPSARGSWPAIWLLPAVFTWPPEIDIVEGMAWGPHQTEIHSGLITREEEQKDYPTFGDWFDVGVDPSKDFHEYRLDWSKDKLAAYFDGKILWERPTPPSMQTEMRLLINLAVGGQWAANELGIQPIDNKSPERLGRASDMIEDDYPATLIIKSVKILE